ncbi:MAG: DNA polymerase III subunit [Pirellulaceae bacterium]
MSWDQIFGHDHLVDRFRTAVARERLGSAFLFVGPDGIGKRRFALELASALLCERNPESELNACGQCEACQMVAAGSHPDLFTVEKPDDKASIPVELIIGDRDHRNRKGLRHEISLSPFRGGRKIVVIDDADFLFEEAANSLLKTLEEPPPRSVLILLVANLAGQLPTIRSRCQVVHFQPLSNDQVEQILGSLTDFEPAVSFQCLASLSAGSLDQAMHWADPTLLEFRTAFLAVLGERQWASTLLAKQVADFLDQAGKEAAARRDRFRTIVQCAEQFYRALMRRLIGQPHKADEALCRAVDRAAEHWQAGTEGVARCLDRCLDAEREVAANANQALLVECWLDDLAGHTNMRKGAAVHVY